MDTQKEIKRTKSRTSKQQQKGHLKQQGLTAFLNMKISARIKYNLRR